MRPVNSVQRAEGEVRPRQAGAPGDTTSINWWPYPAYGVTTTPVPVPVPTPTPIPQAASAPTTLYYTPPPAMTPALPSSDTPPPSSSIVPTATQDPSPVSSDLSSSSAPDPSSSDSPSTSASLIQITALPPSSTTISPLNSHDSHSTTDGHSSISSPIDLRILIPIVSVIAIVLGVFIAWYAHKRLKKSRATKRGDTLLRDVERDFKFDEHGDDEMEEMMEGDETRLLTSGKYTPRSGSTRGAGLGFSLSDRPHKNTSSLRVEPDLDLGTPSKHTVHGSVYKTGSGLKTASSRKGSVRSFGSRLLSGTPRGEIAIKQGPGQTLWPAPSPSVIPRYDPPPNPPTRTRTRARSPEQDCLSSEDDEVDITATRPSQPRTKSMRIHLLNRLRSTSTKKLPKLPRDRVISELRSGPAYSSVGTPMDEEDEDDFMGRRGGMGSTATTPFLRDGEEVGDSTEWIAGSGFRIVEEDPEEDLHEVARTPTRTTRMNGAAADDKSQDGWMFWTKSWVDGVGASVGLTKEEQDRYTPVPERRSRSQRSTRDIQRRGTGMSRGDRHGRTSPAAAKPRTTKSLPRDSSVLPLSPPTILSPALESQLLFNPTSQIPPVRGGPSARSTRTTMTSSAPDTPSSLPTPTRLHHNASASSSPSTRQYRISLKSSTDEHATRLPLERKMTQSSVYSDSNETSVSALVSAYGRYAESEYGRTPALGSEGGRTPAERHRRREGAMGKVEEIIGKGWAEREDEVPTRSTMYGAVVRGRG